MITSTSSAFSAARTAHIAAPVLAPPYPVPYSSVPCVQTDATNLAPGARLHDYAADVGRALTTGCRRLAALAVLIVPAMAAAQAGPDDVGAEQFSFDQPGSGLVGLAIALGAFSVVVGGGRDRPAAAVTGMLGMAAGFIAIPFMQHGRFDAASLTYGFVAGGVSLFATVLNLIPSKRTQPPPSADENRPVNLRFGE